MTSFRKYLIDDIVRMARDGKQITEQRSIQRRLFARILRLAKRLSEMEARS